MQSIRPFQIALLAIFAIFAILSIVFLASFEGFIAREENRYGERVVIWGPFDDAVMMSVIQEIARTDKAFNVVTYVEKDPRTFASEFVDALAEGQGPDAIIMSNEDLVSFRTKLLPVPYEAFSLRTFKDRFVDGAEIFARIDGIYALPIAVDPLVMYWNRDLLSQNGISQPPATWETLVGTVVPEVTRRDGFRNITTSAVAFGEYANVTNAKEVLLTLATQSGSQLVEDTDRGYRVLIDTPPTAGGRPPMNAALTFFTDFSNAQSSLYTWNGSMENDKLAFIGGDLALYFGYGSEEDGIEARNPNLNFDTAAVPQGASATVKRVYGTFYGMAIPRASTNPQGSYAAIQTLLTDEIAGTIAERLALAPASRTLIAAGASDPHRQIVLDAALIARSWLDPNPASSDNIFTQMVSDVVSGRQKVANAVVDAIRRLELAF